MLEKRYCSSHRERMAAVKERNAKKLLEKHA